jgi:hypothetical protein
MVHAVCNWTCPVTFYRLYSAKVKKEYIIPWTFLAHLFGLILFHKMLYKVNWDKLVSGPETQLKLHMTCPCYTQISDLSAPVSEI